MGFLDLFRRSSEPESENDYDLDDLRKTETETRTAIDEFTIRHAEITYPDGSTERVEYTNREHDANSITLYDHDGEDYFVYHYVSRNEGKDDVWLEIDWSKPRTLSLANIRDIEVTRIEEVVGVANVEVDVQYTRNTPDHEWKEYSYTEIYDKDSPDVTVWNKYEWEAASED